ncbi:hypothetical protein N7488_005586 [Penicillium malachiteum]|nr:hypothetical protein N7488_005586 [Penicillium malachiteum]
MSAQKSGRQSPPEERLSGIQQRETPGSGKIGSSSSSRPAPDFSKKESERTKSEVLTSNPEHPLEKIEAAKFAKGSRA